MKSKNVGQQSVLGFLMLISLIFSCEQKMFNEGKSAEADSAMVVSAHPEATRVGIEIMKNGGNAVDAMVGVHFALAVVYPSAGNIGGGGFLVYRSNAGEFATLDFREKAPASAFDKMYQNEDGSIREGESIYGPKSSGVPGSVDGVLKAHARFGSLPLADLIDPAIKLAKEGFSITANQARNYNNNRNSFIENNRDSLRVALVKQGQWEEGDRLLQPDLAETLIRIREEGRNGFYEGQTAQLIVEEMKHGAGWISLEDLRNYEAKWREPVSGNYKNYTVTGMGPPSSGGIALMQLLKMAENFDLKTYGHNSAQTVHLMTEMERRVYADRATHLGDSDFWDVPIMDLLDDQYIESRISQIDPSQATSSDSVKAMESDYYAESEETTHYSIIDPFGNAVAVTTTINSGYGSKTFVQGAGFLLNNEMDDFSIKAGHPNVYGLLGGEANAIQAEKRMLSAMTPTIVEKDGKLLMVVGTPGGSTIITSVFQTILNVLEHGMSMEEAVAAKRLHHQWYPDIISMESHALSDSVQDELIQMGHSFNTRGAIGRVDAILVKEDGTLEGAADPRGDDWSAGF